jgi:hypothetical protein
MKETRASALHDALNNGVKIAPTAATQTEDRSDWLTWTLKMSPSQADHWDELLVKLAKATGLRIRRSGRSSKNGETGLNRREMVEALVDLAENDDEVWAKLVDKIQYKNQVNR